jgi:hypothetical protein
MKNIFLAIVLTFFCAPAFAGDCCVGSRVASATRTVVSGTVDLGRRVLSVPVRTVRVVRENSANRRSVRRAARSCGC